jgi:hypothetical protein
MSFAVIVENRSKRFAFEADNRPAQLLGTPIERMNFDHERNAILHDDFKRQDRFARRSKDAHARALGLVFLEHRPAFSYRRKKARNNH